MNEKSYRISSNKLKIITVELPKFHKSAAELETILDSWLFCFKHLHKLEQQPPEIKGKVFEKLFEWTKINKLTSENMALYNKSLAKDNDVRLMMEYNHEKGFKTGREEGIRIGISQIAIEMKRTGMPIELIVQLTGLTPQQIRQIKAQ
jgi:predicted transposase/invertase (TIGR01784 family)